MFWQFIKKFLETLNPSRYHRFREKMTKQTLSLYGQVLLFALIIMAIVFVPVMKTTALNVQDTLGTFDELNFNLSVTTTEPVILASHPKILLDTNASGLENSKLTFSKHKYFYRPYYFFGEKSQAYQMTGDLKNDAPILGHALRLILLFLIPAIVVFVGLFAILVTLLLTFLAAFIAQFFITKKKASLRDLWVAAIHAWLVPLFLIIILLPVFFFFWFGVLFFVVLFFLGVMLLRGEDIAPVHKKSSKKSSKHSKKKDEIFDEDF